MSKQRLAMVVDAAACIDCKACQMACKVANRVPAGYWRNWIKAPDLGVAAQGRHTIRFQPGNCMHCEKPTCVEACPTGATYIHQADGTVLIDRELCIGCGQCLPACPYGARFRHPELKVADKCDFCQDRRAAGLEPACVSTCPTKARVFGDLNDPNSEAAKFLKQSGAVQVVNKTSDTNPQLFYLGDPGVANWPVEARMPLTHEIWRAGVKPVVNILLALTGLGVIGMLAKQIIMPKDTPIDKSGDDGETRKGGGHE